MKSINEALPGTIEKGKNIIEKISDILQGNPDKSPNAYLGGSISQYSKNLVMTFPVLCDNTISPETASMINKANERNITTMLMMLFTAMNIEANDGMKVLSMIHKNITTNMDVYDVMDKAHEPVLWYIVEELLQVYVHYPYTSVIQVFEKPEYCLLTAPSRSESIASV